jgi:hypothetical protein
MASNFLLAFHGNGDPVVLFVGLFTSWTLLMPVGLALTFAFIWGLTGLSARAKDAELRRKKLAASLPWERIAAECEPETPIRSPAA